MDAISYLAYNAEIFIGGVAWAYVRDRRSCPLVWVALGMVINTVVYLAV